MENTPPEHLRIRRLLALKAHETPPPGTFSDLRRAVRARIESEARQQPAPTDRLIRRWAAAWPRWLQPATIIPTGLALMAISAFVLRQSTQPTAVSPVVAQQAGIGSLFEFKTNQTGAIPNSMGLSPGMTYRIEIQTDDATATLQSIRIIPLGPAASSR